MFWSLVNKYKVYIYIYISIYNAMSKAHKYLLFDTNTTVVEFVGLKNSVL